MKSDQMRLIVAVVLSGIVLIGWQMFFAPKEIKTNQTTIFQQKESDSKTVYHETPNNMTSVVSERTRDTRDPEARKFTLESNGTVFEFTNDLKILASGGENINEKLSDVFENEIPFEIFIIRENKQESIRFDLSENHKNNSISGKNEKYNIVLNMQYSENGKLHFSLNSTKPYHYRMVMNSKEKSERNRIREYVLYRKDIDRIAVGDGESGDGNIKWIGLDYNYHLFAFVFEEKKTLKFQSFESGQMVIDTVNPNSSFSGYMVFKRKNYDELMALGDKLGLSVDFGIFGIIAVPMLRGLQYLYKHIPNYGVAIILLTLIIRLVLFPLNYKSFKSMKKMQQIQPELNKIKEKFKGDPQRMQKETMAAFKKGGANPLGGCLPMLLQIPIFFAFYRVLFSSVELVGAPFFGWIHDLSIKDPYYVLPVLMTATMFIQQKFMPSASTDPTQKKIMLIMPLVFGVIMKDLPAGLALYIFVSTLVGIVQQVYVNKTVR
ncbi:MAG: membrane protein insertase YidC [Bacteriovoracaceae bacterium]|nr:membrane protein insertase YidC [Bacteriovoracaceae bacterium]